MSFLSSTFDRFTIEDATATFTGSGTVNGEGPFRFDVTAVDDALDRSRSTDWLEVRIWDPATQATVYHNVSSDGDDRRPGGPVRAGEIVVARSTPSR